MRSSLHDGCGPGEEFSALGLNDHGFAGGFEGSRRETGLNEQDENKPAYPFQGAEYSNIIEHSRPEPDGTEAGKH